MFRNSSFSICIFLIISNVMLAQVSADLTTPVLQNNLASDGNTYATAVKKERYKMAIITPMFLDSFDLAKNLVPLPKFAAAGIDFYEGTLVASDTLKSMQAPIDLYIYDSKSRFMNMNTLVESDKLDDMDVIIGNVSASELSLLADFARTKKINFVSAISPADGGQTDNPYFTLMQPRLVTHVEKMYAKINAEEDSANVIFLYRDASSEKNANTYFKNAQAANGSNNKIMQKTIQIKGETITLDALKKTLDVNKQNVIVCAVLDAATAQENLKVMQQAAEDGFKIKVYGMPSWDNIKSLKDADAFANVEIYHTSAQIVEKTSVAGSYLQNQFKKRMGTNPTDLTLKATNVVYYFANLLMQNGVPFNSKMNSNTATFSAPVNIQAVLENGAFKYWENSFLYMVKYKNGAQTFE